MKKSQWVILAIGCALFYALMFDFSPATLVLRLVAVVVLTTVAIYLVDLFQDRPTSQIKNIASLAKSLDEHVADRFAGTRSLVSGRQSPADSSAVQLRDER